VTDATELKAKPTIDAILAQGGSVILMSHLGRPKVEEKYSLKHILKTTSSGSSGEVCF
jgi:phosphoglycerate kinase